MKIFNIFKTRYRVIEKRGLFIAQKYDWLLREWWTIDCQGHKTKEKAIEAIEEHIGVVVYEHETD